MKRKASAIVFLLTALILTALFISVFILFSLNRSITDSTMISNDLILPLGIAAFVSLSLADVAVYLWYISDMSDEEQSPQKKKCVNILIRLAAVDFVALLLIPFEVGIYASAFLALPLAGTVISYAAVCLTARKGKKSSPPPL